jgi:hypothetical protein
MRNAACLGGIVLAVSTLTAQKADPSAILAAAGDYIAAYERDVVAVVAQEAYRQRVPSLKIATRQLRSDLLMIADAERGWLEFRDVFEVDGRSVRDHDDRIAQLFLKPHPNAHLQAARIVEESARFNLSPTGVTLHRTLNIPLEALRFLRKANQPRSQFELAGEERADVGTLVVLKFQEQAKPRLIQSPEETPASGRFWIEPLSGAVIRSELKMSARDMAATISVRFARQLEPSIWLPASMAEEYDAFDRSRRAAAISGYATYSNFRRFRVDVSSDIKSST